MKFRAILLSFVLVFNLWMPVECLAIEFKLELLKIQVLYKTKRYQSVIKEATEGLKKDPTYPHFYTIRGASYYKLGQMDKAIRDCTLAIKYDKGRKHMAPYFTRGTIYAERREFEKAKIDLTTALKYDPKNWQIYLTRSHVNRAMALIELADADLNKAKSLGYKPPASKTK